MEITLYSTLDNINDLDRYSGMYAVSIQGRANCYLEIKINIKEYKIKKIEISSPFDYFVERR